MHDSSFWYQYSTVSPRGAREGPGGGTAPLGPPSDPPMLETNYSLQMFGPLSLTCVLINSLYL